MSALNLPEDLRSFLSAGHALEYEPSRCHSGVVTLLPIERLTIRTIGARVSPYSDLAGEDPHVGERGYYLVPAVSLIGSCENYRPAGVLLWLPDAGVFGTWDDDHGTLWVFPGVSWSQIVAGPVPYLNACWEPRQVHADQLRLWEMYEYQPRRGRT